MRARGFTLIELMIVVAIIAIIAAIAVPNLLSARMQANEAAAVSVLRSVTTAQAQFWKSCYADEDNDGQGEYGSFAELGGVIPARGTSKVSLTSITATMAQVSLSGEVRRSGYIFRMYLPAAGGVGFPESPTPGGMPVMCLDYDLAEVGWCCYAYPQQAEGSGRRTFFVNQQSEILQTEDPNYAGGGCTALKAGAALKVGDITHITGQIAIGTRGADGNFWRPVQ